jgi:hypothetical protein
MIVRVSGQTQPDAIMVEIVVLQIQLQATLFIGGDLQRGVDGGAAAEMTRQPSGDSLTVALVRAIFSLSLSLMLKLPRNISISATPRNPQARCFELWRKIRRW